jgi:hypothetical protein
VIESVDQLTNERVLTILDDERVYVVTADDGSSINACNFDSKKRYYELPLDYQFESSLIVDGDINSIALVKESLARSKLIFGWIPDVNDPNQEKEVMSYAYLGYDGEAKDLTLFDKDQEVIWTQKRELETFDIVNLGQGNISTKYMLNIRPLYNLYYIVQLGLDVFVVDSGKELLSKVQSEVDTILTDKVVTITAYGDSTNSIVPIVENGFDDENLFIIDQAKIYHSSYLADAPPRNPSQVTKFIGQNPTGFDRKAQLINRSFSQFDLKECLEDDLACYAANDVESQAWQFFTPCEEQYGCEITDDENDFCETLAEKLQTQSDQVLCTPSDYQHISELNDEANDAKLLAYMQYNEKYIRQRIFTSNHDQLFVTARMNHKDVFLTYNFKMDFSQPKALRERVLFGKRASLFGMDAYINDGNLYLTALQQSSIRSNECYKYGQNVTCELGNMEDAGPPIICTGKDLAEGLCFNQFKEYESKAFFCSAEQ